MSIKFRIRRAATFIIGLLMSAATLADVFPGNNWEAADAAALGLDQEAIEKLSDEIEAAVRKHRFHDHHPPWAGCV